MTEQLENQENQGESVQRESFNPEEQTRIGSLVDKLFNENGYKRTQGFVDLDDDTARKTLELMGCDFSKVEDLAKGGLPKKDVASRLIAVGKAKETVVSSGLSEKNSNSETANEGTLVVTKSLDQGSTLEIATSGSIVKIVPEPSSPTGLIAEIYFGNVQVGKKELQLGNNTIGRATENDIVIQLADVSRKHAVIEVSQAGYSVKDLNSTNGTISTPGESPIKESEIQTDANANHDEINEYMRNQGRL